MKTITSRSNGCPVSPLPQLTKIFFLLSTLFVAVGFGQDRSSHVIQPGVTAENYSQDEVTSLNLYSGNTTTSLPVVRLGGRGESGFELRFALSRQWVVDNLMETCGGNPPNEYPCAADWGKIYSYPNLVGTPNVLGSSPGQLNLSGELLLLQKFGIAWYKDGPGRLIIDGDECSIPSGGTIGLSFIDQEGNLYRLRDKETNGQPLPSSNLGREFVSGNGSSITFISDSDIIVPNSYGCSEQGPSLNRYDINGYLALPNGIRYRVESSFIKWMRDRNGNITKFYYDQTPTPYSPYGHLIKVVDALNREINISYAVSEPAPYGLSDVITVKGFGGATRTYHISYGALSDNLRSDVSSSSIGEQFNDVDPNVLQPNTAYSSRPTPFYAGVLPGKLLVAALWLPNGKSYRFKYNNYGEMARVEVPTTGAYEFDWGTADGGTSSGLHKGGVYGYSWIYRRVKERRVYTDEGLSGITTYSVENYNSGNPDPTVAQVDSWNTSATRLKREKHFFYGNAEHSKLLEAQGAVGYYSDWKDGKEYKTERIQANGTTVLTRETKVWEQTNPSWVQCSGSGCIAPENNPHISEVNTTLVDTNQVTKRSLVYDQFNNITEARDYDFGSGIAGALLRKTQTTYVTAANYTSGDVYLLRLPSQLSVFDADGIERARTTLEYDNYTSDTNHASLIGRTSISGLDTSFTTTYTPRGNATGTATYLLSASGSVLGSITAYLQYDVAGNVVKAIDGRGYSTLFEYDDRFGTPDGAAQSSSAPGDLGGLLSYAFATKTVNTLGQIRYNQFDYYLGRPVDLEDENGIVTSSFYDNSLDRLSQIKRAVGTAAANHTVYDYDDTNRVITTTADLNSNNDGLLVTKAFYDQLGRTIEERQYEGGSNYVATRTQYDSLGRAYMTSNPYRPWQSESPVWTTRTFDALGRILSVTTPDNAIASSSYSGNAFTVTDQAGKAKRSVIDSVGRLRTLYEDPVGLNYQTTYDYDALDDITTVTQGAQVRTFGYDSLRRLTSATNPESGTLSYDYDSNGNLLHRTDARTVTTTYAYDALNRLISCSYNDTPQTPTINFYYDAQTLPGGAPSFDRGYSTGRVIGVTFGGGSSGTYRGYDQLGRVVRQYQQTDSTNYLVEASFYANNSIQNETYPAVPGASDRRLVSFTNDSAGRLFSLSSSATSYAPGAGVSNIAYTPHNALSIETYSNSLIHSITYNNRLQPSEIRLGTSGAPASIIDLVYNYGTTNNNGSVRSVSHTGGGLSYTQTFSYDAMDRLTTSQENSGSSWSQTNGYDRYGNRWIDLGGGNQSLYFTASNNRIAGSSYDNSGNLLNDGYHTYAFDGESRIAKVDSVTAYVYNGEGQRVRKFLGENLRLIYDISGDLIAEFDGSTGALKKEYIYGASGLAASIEPTAVNSNGTRYTTTDHLGSPRVLTNSSAGVVSRHDYMPFGEELGSGVGGRTVGMGFIVTDGQRKKFTSKERDSETGLDYFETRYYSSTQGRFTTVDPESAAANPDDGQSWHGYAYGRNNPLKYTDPDGKKYLVCDAEGKNCREVSDDDFWKERKEFEKTGNVYTGSRDFYEYGQINNAEGGVVATYVQISIDDPVREFIFQMRRQTAPIPKATAAFFGISVVLGTGGGLLYYAVTPLLAPTVTTLGLGGTTSTTAVDLSVLSIQQLNGIIRGTQKQLLNKLFGQGMQGAERALESGEVPAGLTRETLMVAKEIAKRAIEKGIDKGGVQAARLKIIEEALKKLK